MRSRPRISALQEREIATMIRAVGGASLIVLMSSTVFGQPAPSVRGFEVASVKPHEGPMRSVGIATSGLRLNADAVNVRGLIMYAYNLNNSRSKRHRHLHRGSRATGPQAGGAECHGRNPGSGPLGEAVRELVKAAVTSPKYTPAESETPMDAALGQAHSCNSTCAVRNSP